MSMGHKGRGAQSQNCEYSGFFFFFLVQKLELFRFLESILGL